MRRRPLHAPATAAIAAFVVGCTFLVKFEDTDVGVDAALDAPPAPSSEAAPAFPPPCDPAFPLAMVKCNPKAPRPNCAKTTAVFPDYPAGHERTNDLVTCNGSTAPTCVQHCPFGCAVMPNGFPDQCDDCVNRKDGTYCVKDLRSPSAQNLGLAIDCKDGKTVEVYKCGETAPTCATKCPRTDRAPSCCI